MSSDVFTITIKNWDKHNPKRDQKSYTWLRLNNDISTDPELFALDAEQKFVWIEILCQASRKNSGTIKVNLSQISYITKVSLIKINQLIEFLEQKPIIEVHDRALPRDVVTTTPTYEQDVLHETNVRTIETSAKASAPSLGSQLFETYSKAFFKRYGVNPVRNAKTNSLCKQLATRLGEEAHQVIEFYLSHNDQWFLKMQHDLASLVSKAESMHSQWQRGQAVTSVQVRQFEKQSSNMDLLEKVNRGEI